MGETDHDEKLNVFVGEWELAADFAGAEDLRGQVTFEWLGNLLVERASVPHPAAPDSLCVIATRADGTYLQHYFDSRGVVRLYEMTFDGTTWTLQRSSSDFSPLDFHQRFVGQFSGDGSVLEGEWQTSSDGQSWVRDFRLSYRRVT